MAGRVIDDEAGLRELLAGVRRVAVLGMKTEEQRGQAAFYVPEYLASAGLEIIPVPVYYPEVTEILGRKVYRRLADIPGEVDLVDVFRKPVDIPAHLPDLLEKKPKAVWMQTGIRHDEAARKLVEAGIDVVQSRCLMVDYRRLGPRPG